MKLILLVIVGFPIIIFAFVLIRFYKVFVKKHITTPFYTPFDEITGQSQVGYHLEQTILAEDEEQGNGKNK